MQIKKINENQIEVILNVEDLQKNNISIHSFMCNLSESKKLYFNILNFVNYEIGFELKNHEVFMEAFSVPSQNSFILVISRVPKKIYLHTSKLKYCTFKFNKSLWIKFDRLEEFCMFCNSLITNIKAKSSLYLLNDCYFLHIKLSNIKDYFKISTFANEFSNKIYNNDFTLDENSEIIIKNSAIEMCKRYFV